MSRRPRIVVTSSRRGGFGMWSFTRALVWAAGGVAVRVAPGRAGRLERPVDGMVLGGGVDVDPSRYGELLPHEGRVDPPRDQLEWRLLQRAFARDTPLLGICRGAQLLNVFCGGTLHQDLAVTVPGHSPRRHLRPCKPVSVQRGSRLHAAVGRSAIEVNSIHRQGVAKLGEGLEVTARDHLGIVQGLEAPRGPLRLGVQWHPELLPFGAAHRGLFRALVAAARG
jgi:putative glutamine amidotransferase